MLWSAWYAAVMPYVVGAPAPLVDQALRTTTRAFMRRARCWVVWLDPVRSAGRNGVEYEFEIPEGAEVLGIEKATHGGQPLKVISFRAMPADPARHGDKQHGIGLVTSDLQTYRLVADSVGRAEVQAQVVLIPSITSTGIPDDLANRFFDALADGARAELMLVPGTGFFNPEMAAYAGGRMEQALAVAMTQAYFSNTQDVPRRAPDWV